MFIVICAKTILLILFSRERAKYTAARECYEETLGIFGSNKSLVSMLENYVENNVFKVSSAISV